MLLILALVIAVTVIFGLSDTDYRRLMSSYSKYKYEQFSFYGVISEIFQVEDVLFCHVTVDSGRDLFIAGRYGEMPFFLEQDRVYFKDISFFQPFTYETIGGNSRTVPLFLYSNLSSARY